MMTDKEKQIASEKYLYELLNTIGKAIDEIEQDLFCGRAAWLYKQLEREIKRQEAQRLEESRVLASGWR